MASTSNAEAASLPLHMRRKDFSPISTLAEIRQTDRVRAVGDELGVPVYLVTRHDDVKLVLSDSERFSIEQSAQFVMPGSPAVNEQDREAASSGNLLGLDPPRHTRLRRMLAGQFTGRRMKRLEPRIVELVETRLDAMQRNGPPSDLVADFALPIPSLVICELLGVPEENREDFQSRSARQLDLSLPLSERVELQRESAACMQTLVSAARRTPGEDMLGMLVREHGHELTDDELVGICGLLLLAGHETTSSMLSLGTLALLKHPDQLSRMRDDPEAVVPGIEELLRWLSVVHSGIPRITTTDVEIAGVVVPRNSMVFVSLPSGNRDPAHTDRPDAFDVGRAPTGHLAFGHGAHYCLGAPLARIEMRIAFPALLQRFPTLHLGQPFDEVQFRSFHFIYGLQSLRVSW